PRHAVRHEVFHLAGQHVARHDQAVPPPRQAVGPLAPEYRPFHLPDLRPTLRILDAVTLPLLLAEGGRIAQQVLHFARRSATRQARIVFLAARTPRPTSAEHPRSDHPAVEVRRHFP